MAYTVVDKGSKYFVTTTYTGDGTNPRTVTTGLANDFVWIKSRTDGDDHRLVDSVRGASAFLESDSTLAEATTPANVLSFTSTGFTLSAGGAVNFNGETYVSWSWVGGGAGVSNTQGSITSTVSANTTSGFSIVSYTGNGTSGATVGHGLGVAPAFTIVKNRSTGGRNWQGFHQSLGNTKSHLLNSTEVPRTSSVFWNNTSPTSTLITLGNDDDVNQNTNNFIAYCFAEVKGFSKAFSYTGNGSSDGTYVHLGFRPAWVMVKASSTTGQWAICDNRRGTANTANGEFLFAESSEATNSATNNWDFLSNGLKARANYAAHNTSGVTYIGFAVAENPFVSSKGVPTTAR